MSIVTRLRNSPARIAQIAAFARTGLKLTDRLKMSVVGFARGHQFSGSGIVARAGRRTFSSISVRPALLGGLTMQLDPSDLSHLIVSEEVILDDIYNLAEVPFTPNMVIDCGAHIGLFTLRAAALFRRASFTAFEPDPDNACWLRRQIERNKLAVRVIEAAVSVEDGVTAFDAGRGCGSALAELSPGEGKYIDVPTVNLREFVAKAHPASLLLKLDIEGAEESVLPHILPVLPEECAIFMETHYGEDSWRRLTKLLTHSQFVCRVTRTHDQYVDGFALRTAGRGGPTSDGRMGGKVSRRTVNASG